MQADILLLVFRIAATLALYVFFATLIWLMWRDLRLLGDQVTVTRQPLGRLVVVDCAEDVPLEAGQSYPLTVHTTIGRGPTNTIVLPDSYASTEHAQVILRSGKWWLHDRGSRNGTTINDLPVSEPVVLSSDDVIGIGRVKLKFQAESKKTANVKRSSP